MSVGNVTAAAGGRVIRQGIRAGLQAQHQQPHRPPQHAQNAILQASLAARVQQINFTIRKLQPKSAALRDPRARKEVERRLQDLSRQGMFITEAAKELDAILSERGRAW